MSGLSPMSRLLIMAGLTSIGTEQIHFIDADRASFAYAPVSNPHSSASSNNNNNNNKNDLSVAHGGRQAETDNGALPASSRNSPQPVLYRNDRPPPGQIGLLQFDPYGRGNEFIMSLDQDLPERLRVTANIAGASSGEIEDSGDLSSGVVVEVESRGVRGGGRRARVSGSSGNDNPRPVCVKYLSTVGRAAVQRVDWFPSREDGLSLQRAIDAYCPISWLRGGYDSPDVEGGEKEGKLRHRRRRASEREHGADDDVEDGRLRRLLLYQRDQNRKIVDPDQVS